MTKQKENLEQFANQEYKYGFTTDIDTDVISKGLNEDIIRMISKNKNEPEFMLEHRLKAFKHWKTLKEPRWSYTKYPKIDFQDIHYYAAPKNTNHDSKKNR